MTIAIHWDIKQQKQTNKRSIFVFADIWIWGLRVLRNACKTLIQPKQRYAAPIWNPYSKTQNNQIEKTQSMAACLDLQGIHKKFWKPFLTMLLDVHYGSIL